MNQLRVAVKHTNPCGIASAQEIETAFIWAKEGDPVSIFGGIVGPKPAG